MGYTVSWYIPNQVIQLQWLGYQSDEDLQQSNQEILRILDDANSNLDLLIDATQLKVRYKTADDLRTTQTYVNHPKLNSAMVVAIDKLVKLMTIIAFNTSAAKFRLFQDYRPIEKYYQNNSSFH